MGAAHSAPMGDNGRQWADPPAGGMGSQAWPVVAGHGVPLGARTPQWHTLTD